MKFKTIFDNLPPRLRQVLRLSAMSRIPMVQYWIEVTREEAEKEHRKEMKRMAEGEQIGGEMTVREYTDLLIRGCYCDTIKHYKEIDGEPVDTPCRYCVETGSRKHKQ